MSRPEQMDCFDSEEDMRNKQGQAAFKFIYKILSENSVLLDFAHRIMSPLTKTHGCVYIV